MKTTTLTFTVDKKKYISKPFDFEAACKVNDVQGRGETQGVLNLTKDAVSYMFDGTEATPDIINSLPVAVMMKMCMQVWDMYLEALTASTEKNG